LKEKIARDQTQLTVETAKGFPAKAPFRIRIGTELMQVTAATGVQWTVQRGFDSTAMEQPAEALVELVPLAPAPGDAGVDAAARALAAINPFQKPGPVIDYKPQVTPSGTQEVVRGKPLAITLGVQSWNPIWGAAAFELQGDIPEGMTLDRTTGDLKWSPSKDLPAGEYKVQVAAIASAAVDQRVNSELTLKLKNPNEPPKFKPLDAPKAWLGRPLTLTAAAEDPDEKDRLRYRLTGTPPAGARINERTGQIDWTPSEDLAAGDYKIEVTVTDNGEPPLSEKKTIDIKAEDDAARFTELTGVVEINGVKQARLHNKLTNKVTPVYVGDTFQFSEVTGKVLEIGRDFIIVDSNGSRMRLGLELEHPSIRNMTPAPPASAAEGSPISVPEPAKTQPEAKSAPEAEEADNPPFTG
jgi:hypothetical protein